MKNPDILQWNKFLMSRKRELSQISSPKHFSTKERHKETLRMSRCQCTISVGSVHHNCPNLYPLKTFKEISRWILHNEWLSIVSSRLSTRFNCFYLKLNKFRSVVHVKTTSILFSLGDNKKSKKFILGIPFFLLYKSVYSHLGYHPWWSL